MNTVSPSVFCNVLIRTSKSPAAIGSSPEVGSSRNTIAGSSASARANATRLVMPPDNSEGNLSPSSGFSPTISSLAVAISSINASDSTRFSRKGNWMFCRTVSDENSAPCWNRMPHRPAALWVVRSWLPPIAAPITSISPLCRGMRPMIVRIKTDLPPPEAPTRPRISPLRTSSDRWSITTCRPKPTTSSLTRIANCGFTSSMVTFRPKRRKSQTTRRARSPERSTLPPKWWSACRETRRFPSRAGLRYRRLCRSPAP